MYQIAHKSKKNRKENIFLKETISFTIFEGHTLYPERDRLLNKAINE